MPDEPVALKVLLHERHWTYGTFSTEYDKAAKALDPRLSRTAPSRAQFQRWLAGDLRRQPRPDACRVLEALFPGWTVEQLFAGYSDHQAGEKSADAAPGDSQVLGIIDVPADGSRYMAALGWGSFCGDEPLQVRPAADLKEAIVTFGDYAVGEQAEAKNEARLVVTSRLAQRAQRVRMLGSAAIDLAWLAHGRTDAAVIFGGHPWDTAAGVILVREAGGSVVDARGQRHKLGSASTLAASPELLDQVLGVVPRP